MNPSKMKASSSLVNSVSQHLNIAFPIFFFLIALSFYLRTYDSAMVKITELQMFGTLIIALWLCKIFETGHWPLKKNQTLTILPILLILASGILSFLRSPLPWGSFDFFLRRVMYVGIALIAATEMTSQDNVRNVLKWLIRAVAVCTIYGLIQWLDFRFFPPGPPTVGLDKFVWRGAFGPRVFSTFGNPNFFSNFLVIIVPILGALYLKTRKFYLLPLLVLTLLNIYWTGSKGPAMGLIGSTGVFALLFIRFFIQSRKIKIIVLAAAFVFVSLLGGYIVKRVFYDGSITSFTFRMYTWLSTWEMVQAKPILGNGIGAFWVLYPAYRRPAIFHIEGKHNTETDHAENEHLEVWMDEGIVGMGLWIWLIVTLSIGLYKTLQALTAHPSRAGPSQEEGGLYPEGAYHVLGILSGFLGMLVHNFTDVSMRFVSSGVPFWLLVGMSVALIMYHPLPETPPLLKEPDRDHPTPLRQYLLLVARVILVLSIAIIAIRIIRQFDWCQGRDGMRNPNDVPHFIVSWTTFLICWGCAVWWFLQIALKTTHLRSLFTLQVAVILLVPFWGFFIGDVNHNRAIFFSKQGVWAKQPGLDAKTSSFPPEYQRMYAGKGDRNVDQDALSWKILCWLFPDMAWRQFGIGGALEHYQEVNRLRPDFIMAHYFRGNVFNDWGAQYAQKTQEAFNAGDVTQGDIYRKRADELWNHALDAYASTRALGPNYVQMHHQVGNVHQKWGDFFHNLAPLAEKYGAKKLAEEYRKEALDHRMKALEYYQLYYKIDPVYDQNYYRQAQIYTQLGKKDKAEETYLEAIAARECKKPYHQIFGGLHILSVYSPVGRYDLASPRHTHDIVSVSKPELWTVLGDFYSYVKPSPRKAEICYQKAVGIKPDRLDFLKRLADFYGRNAHPKEAIEIWKKVYTLKPDDPDVQRIIRRTPQ